MTKVEMAFILGWLLVLSAGTAAKAGTIDAIHLNKEAIQFMEGENNAEAEKKLLQALGEDPLNPIIKMNLGFVYEVQKKFDKALREYEAVLKDPALPENLKFIAHFNAGNTLAQLNESKDAHSGDRIGEALKHYQKALDLKPDSIEVKTNIEMLFMGGGQGQGQGEGQGGENQNQNQNKGQDPGRGPPPQNENEEKPKFNSKKLSKEDVRKIMEELKSQEQKIRSMEYSNQKGKEAPPEKDW